MFLYPSLFGQNWSITSSLNVSSLFGMGHSYGLYPHKTPKSRPVSSKRPRMVFREWLNLPPYFTSLQ